MPRYKHDCDACIYLGDFRGTSWSDGLPVDLYICPRGYKSLLARFGNDGDYLSAPLAHMQMTLESGRSEERLAMDEYPLDVALALAYAQGHVTQTMVDSLLEKAASLLSLPTLNEKQRDDAYDLSSDLRRFIEVSKPTLLAYTALWNKLWPDETT